MIIREMNATFGTLENRKLVLQDGLNILEGPNESGKSTWCAFIRAMLYGISTTERDTKNSLAAKNRYRPWIGSPMSGTMLVDSHLGLVTLERKGSHATPMREFQAYTHSGEPLPLTESTVGEALLGIGQETFERSAFIDHPEFPTGGGGELERRILSLVTAGEEGTSYSDAQSRLREWQRRLRHNRRLGQIPELEEQMQHLHTVRGAMKEKKKSYAAICNQISALDAERNYLMQELSAHKAASHTIAAQRLQQAEARLAEAEQDLLDTYAQLPPGNPTAEEVRRLEREISAEAERRKFADAQKALIREKQKQRDMAEQQLKAFQPFAGCSIEQARNMVLGDITKLQSLSVKSITRHIRKKSMFFLAIPLLLSIGLFYLFPPLYAAAASLLSAAITFALILLITHRKAKKRLRTIQQALLDKYRVDAISEIDSVMHTYEAQFLAYAQIQSDETALHRELESVIPISEDTIARISEVFPHFTSFSEISSGIHQATSDALAKIERHMRAAMLRNSALSVVEALRSGSSSDTSSMQIVQAIPSIPLDEAEARLEKVNQILSTLRREAAILEGSMENDKSYEELDTEIGRLQVQLGELNEHYDAIELALDTLKEAEQKLRERFSPALNQAAADIFSVFTKSKYSKVVISREFQAMAGSGGSDGIHRALALSRGTIDQLYLAIRFAICRIVAPTGFSIPIILDDAFLSFDESRLQAALDWLYEESKSRQVLLFTCHTREGRYLQDRPGVSVQHF